MSGRGAAARVQTCAGAAGAEEGPSLRMFDQTLMSLEKEPFPAVEGRCKERWEFWEKERELAGRRLKIIRSEQRTSLTRFFPRSRRLFDGSEHQHLTAELSSVSC